MKIGDIVKVVNKDAYYLAVIMEINEPEEMVRVKDYSMLEDNIQPTRCIEPATGEEVIDELRMIYGFY